MLSEKIHELYKANYITDNFVRSVMEAAEISENDTDAFLIYDWLDNIEKWKVGEDLSSDEFPRKVILQTDRRESGF